MTSESADRPRRVRVPHLREAKERGERITMLTAYDAMVAALFDAAGIDVLLVGDSLANVVLGRPDTLSVTVDEMIHHSRAVVSATRHALVVTDLPFGSYEASPEQAMASASRLMKESGTQAVKLEGGHRVADQVQLLTSSGIPVMGHLGFTPQSEHAFGGKRVQGRGDLAADALCDDALALQQAGAFAVVLEMVPSPLAQRVSEILDDPDDRDRCGPALRRSGARLAGHGGSRRLVAEVRQAVRRPSWRPDPGHPRLRRRGPFRGVPRARALVRRVRGAARAGRWPARLWIGSIGAVLAVVVVWPQLVGLAGLPVVANAVALRGTAALVAAAGALVALGAALALRRAQIGAAARGGLGGRLVRGGRHGASGGAGLAGHRRAVRRRSGTRARRPDGGPRPEHPRHGVRRRHRGPGRLARGRRGVPA